MKLKENIVINVTTNKMVGLSDDFICQKKILQNLLDEDEVKNFCEQAKSVNQWSFRSINERQYNVEFWYNAGSLDGNALLEQFYQIVMRCKTVGMRIIGLVCDAGGSNAKLFELLWERQVIPEGGCIPIDMVRTRNPFQPSKRFIYLFHCSTHDLKNIRNALYESWIKKDGAWELLDSKGVKIGKGVVEKCFQ